MSGPKTSVLSPNFMYYNALSEQAKAQWVEKELWMSLLSMQESEKKIAHLLDKVAALQDDGYPNEAIQILVEEAREYTDVGFDDIDEDHDFTRDELSAMREEGAVDVSYVAEGELLDDRLEGKYADYFKRAMHNGLQQKTNIARACAAKAAKMETMVRKLNMACWDLEEAKREKRLCEGVSTSFYIPFTTLADRSGAETTIQKINEALANVSTLVLPDEAREQLRNLKEKAAEIKEASYVSNFYQLVVRPFVEACTKYDAFYQAHFAEYLEYKTSYEILCEELGVVAQEMDISAEAIAFYKEKTEELQNILLKRHARESVLRTVNEVMQEMGYDMVASRNVTKKNGKQYHDELYLYGEGTAISVVHSSEGQLTMEIGGLDHGDRLPTDEEAKNLSAQMVSFCLDYRAIAEVLKKRGIDMKVVSMLPPDEQYATIINLEDYEVTGQVETITQIKEQKRRSEQAQKEKHAEE